jgi:polar amino acid transport system substrate-binding protein
MFMRLLGRAALLVFIAGPAFGAEPTPVRTINLPSTVDSLQARQARFAIEQAYLAMNIAVTFNTRPALRGLIEADAGQLDGEVIRPTTIEATYTNLRRVDVPIYLNGASVWVRKASGPAPATLQALATRKTVGIVRGIQHAESATKGWANVVVANNYPAAMRMLQTGLIDALLGGDGPIRELFVTGQFEMAQFNGADIYATPLFHYLHAKHADILPRVQAELARIKGQHATVLDGLLASGRPGVPR